MIVVMPLAGRGNRLATAGFDTPKPFVDVSGRPMLAWAFDSVASLPYSRAVFVALDVHARMFDLAGLARALAGDRAEIVTLPAVTEGQVCTVLAAGRALDTDEDLLIASADTLVVSNIGDDIRTRPSSCRGLISVARLPGERWSFAAVDEAGRVVRVAEKERISPLASTGLYYFSSAREFASMSGAMVAEDRRTRGEFYVMPVYQDYIDAGLEIRTSDASAVWDMGTPDALRAFEARVHG